MSRPAGDLLRVEIGSPLGGGWEEGGFARHLGSWRLVRARPGCDRKVAESLWAAGLAVYAPRARWVREDPAGKLDEVAQVGPLFDGYVFAALSAPLPPCRAIARVERVEDQLRLVADLDQLEILRRAGRPLLEEPGPAVGDRVVVRNGLLAGLEAVVVERPGRRRLVVEIRLLGRALSVPCSDGDVELLEVA